MAVHNKKNEKTLKTILTEQFVMLSVVLWESFLNELFIEYAFEEPEVAVLNLKSRIMQSLTNKFGVRAANCVQFSVQQPITKVRLTSLLDPKDWNITVNSAQDLTSRANELLHAKFAKTFSLSKSDAQFLDYVVAIRNFLSHRSKGSRSALNDAITRLTELDNQFLKGDTKSISSYLKMTQSNGKSRAVVLVQAIGRLSGKF